MLSEILTFLTTKKPNDKSLESAFCHHINIIIFMQVNVSQIKLSKMANIDEARSVSKKT